MQFVSSNVGTDKTTFYILKIRLLAWKIQSLRPSDRIQEPLKWISMKYEKAELSVKMYLVSVHSHRTTTAQPLR